MTVVLIKNEAKLFSILSNLLQRRWDVSLDQELSNIASDVPHYRWILTSSSSPILGPLWGILEDSLIARS